MTVGRKKKTEDTPLSAAWANELAGSKERIGAVRISGPGTSFKPIEVDLMDLDMVVCPLEDYESERIVEKVIEMLGELEHRKYKNQLLANDLETFDFAPGPYHGITDKELLKIVGEVHDECDRRGIDLNEHEEYTNA